MTRHQTLLAPLDEVIKDLSDLPRRTIVEVGVLKLNLTKLYPTACGGWA